MFPEIKSYAGIFIPQYIESVINGNLITKRKIHTISLEKASPSKVLFVDFNIDVPVLIAYLKADEFIEEDEVFWINSDFKKEIKEIGFNVKRNRNGELAYILFYVKKEKLDLSGNRLNFSDIKKKLFNSYEKDMSEALSIEGLEDLLIDAGKYHLWKKNDLQSNIITYFPASIKSAKNNYPEKDDYYRIKSQHIGSIFIKEKWHNQNNDLFNYLVDARNDILSRMSDYILHRLNLVHSIDSYKRFARRAAIAAISARNVSHNIGSHVIPSIKKEKHGNRLKEITEKDKVFKVILDQDRKRIISKLYPSINSFYYYDTFLEYVSQRNDFVNQLTSTNTTWSISVWFVRELMAKFMNQYFLLNALGEHEGLRIYNFQENRKSKDYNYPTSKYFVDYFKCDRKESIKNVMLYGNIIISEYGFFIFQNYKEQKIKVCGESWKDKGISYDNLKEIIKHQNKRKLRFRGNVTYDYKNNEGEYLLKDGELVSGNIIIKVRLRKYRRLDNQQWSEPYDYSKYLGLENLIDLRSRKYENSNSLEIIKEFEGRYIYGIIKEIRNDRKVIELSMWGEDCSVEFKEHLPEGANILKPGARIIFRALSIDPNNIKFLDATLHEISVSQHLLTTNPEVTPKDIIDNDIKVSIPGGISGYQSFYTILENVIRNSVKHNWVHLPPEEKIARNLEVKIDLSRIEGIDHYIIKVWTNLTDLRYANALVKYDKEHKKIDPGELLNGSQSLTKKLNKVYEGDIIKDNTGDFLRSDLGSIETKINAAYLYNSNEELTSDIVMKQDVLLDDKTPENINKGYIKASRIYEYYNGEIIPKLGIRFKVKKPVELSIYEEGQYFKDIVKDDDTIQIVKKEDFKDPGIIQGDIFLVVGSRGNRNKNFSYKDPDFEIKLKQLNFLEIIHLIIEAPPEVGVSNIEKILKLFTNKVEEFPYRLIYAHDKEDVVSRLYSKYIGIYFDDESYSASKHGKKIKRAMGSKPDADLHFPNMSVTKEQLKKLYNDLLLFKFFLNRIFFVPFDEIKEMSGVSVDNGTYFKRLNKDCEKLKLFLYDKWISRHSFRRVKINTQIFLSKGDASENNKDDLVRSPSQYPDIDNICINISDSIIFPNPGQKESNHISYSRHGHDKKYGYKHRIYCENLSGKKLSYNLFSIFSSSDNYNKLKLKIRLKENGLLKYLILDERLMKYFEGPGTDDEIIKRFHSMGIAIPHYFESKGKPRDVKLSIEKEIKEKLEKQYFDKAENSRENEDMAIKYLLPYNKDVEYKNVINTIFIHQSILEKMIEDMPGAKEDEMNKIILSFKKLFPSVIITSGRNKTAHQTSARFLPFSVIEELLYNENPDKINFTETILKTNL
ncbi:MAG: hypothetical protein AAF502_09305 [Bacteroidota bacterium]